MPFAVLDLDASDPRGWVRALAPERAAGRRLLAAYRRLTLEAAHAAAGRAGPALLGGVRAALQALHAVRGSARGAELEAIAEALGTPPGEILLANLAYDLETRLGCSTVLRDGPGGPLHARNLDWQFPGRLLRRTGCVVRVRGAPAGPYAVIGWPGLLGAFTALAPGRFSISVNFVKLRGERLPGLLARAAAGATPVPWAVRDVLDGARDHGEAVRRLARMPLLSPALFALAGVRRGEGAVVERTPSSAVVRGLADGEACLTNHYLAPGLAGRSVDYDEGGSVERLATVRRTLARSRRADPSRALALLAPVVRPTTQQQVVMRPRDGLLIVRVPGERARRVRCR